MAVLHGVAHNQITFAAYPWTTPQSLGRSTVEALLRLQAPASRLNATAERR